jgi:urease subunit beta
VIPGEVFPEDGTLTLNPGRTAVTLLVENTGDRPIQIGSHYHLGAVNPALQMDRALAWGTRLDIPAGTSVRFEPGIPREVTVVPFVGARIVPGLRIENAGPLDGGPRG